MAVYTKGQTIEIGYGEYNEETNEVEDGGSYFINIDVDKVEEDDIIAIFSRINNILYVQEITEEQSLSWAKENEPISYYLK